MISFQAHFLDFLDYIIKTIYLDNASEFTLKAFNDYYMKIGIIIEHLGEWSYIKWFS